jgi:hypothetical protein
MYTITRPEQTIKNTDGSVYRTNPAETRTFLTAAGLLRFCLEQGVFRQRYINGKPYRFEHLHLGQRDHDKGYDYHLIDTFTRWQITGDHLAAMRRAQARYLEILHHLREVEPQWRPDTERTGNESGLVHYADNSTERHEVNKYGKRRYVMVDPPSGDACF